MFCTLFYSKWCPFVLRSFSYGPRAKNDYKWGERRKNGSKINYFWTQKQHFGRSVIRVNWTFWKNSDTAGPIFEICGLFSKNEDGSTFLFASSMFEQNIEVLGRNFSSGYHILKGYISIRFPATTRASLSKMIPNMLKLIPHENDIMWR